MTNQPPGIDAAALVRESLAHASRLRLDFLLERLVPVAQLRALARTHDVSVKGYRIERAPAAKLAPLLAKLDGEALEPVCSALLTALAGSPVRPAADPGATEVVPASIHALEQQRVADARAKVERSEAQAARLRERVDALQNDLRLEREAHTRTRSEAARLQSAARTPVAPASGSDRQLAQRVHELERDLVTLGEAEAGLRRLLAARETRLREAEQQIQELEALVPKGKRRRKPRPPEQAPAERFRVPYFTDGFYRSFAGKERGSIERALRAVFLLAVEGPAYPGLEVKQIEGQDLWSLRASLKLRVYFRVRDDGDIDVLAFADREDQHTTLRRLKER